MNTTQKSKRAKRIESNRLKKHTKRDGQRGRTRGGYRWEGNQVRRAALESAHVEEMQAAA